MTQKPEEMQDPLAKGRSFVAKLREENTVPVSEIDPKKLQQQTHESFQAALAFAAKNATPAKNK